MTKPPPLPDASRPAWEKRFGKPLVQQKNKLLTDKPRLSDVSHDAWHARYGYKAGEIDRRFKGREN